MPARLVTPDISGRGLSKAIKAAIDATLEQHRAKYLPLHFARTALHRYPEAFAAKKKNRSNRKRTLKEKKRDQELKNKERQNRGPDLDPKNNIPLVEFGRLRLTVLKGLVRFTGSAKRRRMQFLSVPHYTFINPPGQIDKVKALTAVNEPEVRAFAKGVDENVQAYLDNDTQRRQS